MPMPLAFQQIWDVFQQIGEVFLEIFQDMYIGRMLGLGGVGRIFCADAGATMAIGVFGPSL